MDAERIRELRAELAAERISLGELAEISAAAAEAGIVETDEMLADDLLDALEAQEGRTDDSPTETQPQDEWESSGSPARDAQDEWDREQNEGR